MNWQPGIHLPQGTRPADQRALVEIAERLCEGRTPAQAEGLAVALSRAADRYIAGDLAAVVMPIARGTDRPLAAELAALVGRAAAGGFLRPRLIVEALPVGAAAMVPGIVMLSPGDMSLLGQLTEALDRAQGGGWTDALTVAHILAAMRGLIAARARALHGPLDGQQLWELLEEYASWQADPASAPSPAQPKRRGRPPKARGVTA